jgi:hypothetical protein
MAWARWERLHEKARYFDVGISTVGSDQLPDGAPAGVKRVYERDAGGMIADFIANERAIDREGKSAADLLGTTNIGRIGKGIDSPVELPPMEWISEHEALNSLSLSEAVGYNIAEDLERPGGLRLVQWVRGYMALAAWASKQRGDQQELILEIDPAEARGLLQRMSLTRDEADIFLDAVSFGAGSRDFFMPRLFELRKSGSLSEERSLLLGWQRSSPPPWHRWTCSLCVKAQLLRAGLSTYSSFAASMRAA